MTIRRGDVLARLVDQGLWSASFFAFNLAGATLLSVADFASFTVCSSIGVIVAAIVRAWAVDGRLIAGSRISLPSKDAIERKSVLIAGLVGAAVATAASFGWLAAGESSAAWWLPLVAGAIVLADGPHYAVTMYGLFKKAIYAAGVYAILASVVFALLYLRVQINVAWLWIGSLSVVWLVGLFCFRGIPWRNAHFKKSGIPARLSGEAMYGAIGGQVGILIIFLTSPPDDTAGIRLAYAMVFAPVFMLIQGLAPLFLSRMAQLNMTARDGQVRLLTKWIAASAAGIMLSGCVGLILCLTAWRGSNFETVMPFLLPVGASMLGSVFLDSALLQIRFRADPKVPHRIRLAAVGFEACTQFALSVVWGTSGLVWALGLGFILKIAASLVVVSRTKQLVVSDVPDASDRARGQNLDFVDVADAEGSSR